MKLALKFEPKTHRHGKTYSRTNGISHKHPLTFVIRVVHSRRYYSVCQFNPFSVMELRLVSNPLLRSRMPPLLSFLTHSTPPLWRSTAASRQLRLLMPKSPRCTSSNFHTTTRRQRDNASSTAADLDFLEDKPQPKPEQISRSPASQRRPIDDILGSQLDSLLDSTFHTPTPAKRKSSEPADESSAAMIETAFQNSNRTRAPDKHYQEIFRKMQFPPSQELTSAGTPRIVSRDANRTLENTQKTPKRATRTVRSRPAIGRTIEVVPERGVDFGRALRGLEISCAVNKVKQDLSRQRFHERPGLKRKRLKSERWRKLFKASFRATVMRVREMRRKGW